MESCTWYRRSSCYWQKAERQKMLRFVVSLLLWTLLQQCLANASIAASDEAEELIRMLAAAELRDSLPKSVQSREPTVPGPPARDSTTARTASSRDAQADALHKFPMLAPSSRIFTGQEATMSSTGDQIRKNAGEKEAGDKTINVDTDTARKAAADESAARQRETAAAIIATSGSVGPSGCPTQQRVPHTAASVGKISAQLMSSLSPGVMQLVQVLLVGFADRQERQLLPALQHELQLYSRRQSRSAGRERIESNDTAPALVALNLRQMYDVQAPAPSRRQILERNLVHAVASARSRSTPAVLRRESAKGGRCAGEAVHVLGSSYLLYGLLARPLGGSELRGLARNISAGSRHHHASMNNFTAGHPVAEDSAALTLFVLAPRLATPNISSTLPYALDANECRAISRTLACAVHQSARAVLARPQCAFTHYRACGFNLPLLATYDSAFDSWRRQHDISTSWHRSMSILEQEIGSTSLLHRLASCRNRKISFIRPQPRVGSWAFLRTPGGRCTVNALDALAIATSTLLRSVVEFVDMLSVGSNSEHRGIRQAMHSAAEAARAVAALIATRDEDILNLESEELQKHVRGDEEPRVSELEQKNYFGLHLVGGVIISAGLACSISFSVWSTHAQKTTT